MQNLKTKVLELLAAMDKNSASLWDPDIENTSECIVLGPTEINFIDSDSKGRPIDNIVEFESFAELWGEVEALCNEPKEEIERIPDFCFRLYKTGDIGTIHEITNTFLGYKLLCNKYNIPYRKRRRRGYNYVGISGGISYESDRQWSEGKIPYIVTNLKRVEYLFKKFA